MVAIGKRSWGALARALRIYRDVDGEQRAASFAYYVLFSLFPMMALILSIGSFFFSGREIVGTIDGILPLQAGQQQFLWESVVALEEARGGVGLLSGAILLWCSLRFFQALVRGVNRAWHTVEIPWWQVPLKNLAMIAVVSAALFIGILIPAALQGTGQALRWANGVLHEHFPLFDFGRAAGFLDLGRYILGGVVLFGSFALLYILAPQRRVRFADVWFPSVLVAVALMACQVAFVNIIPRVVHYGLYGAVGGMMFLLMWTYFSGMIVMFGGCLCAALGSATPSTPEC